LSADIALAMSRDSLRFETDFMLFDAFRTHLLVRAGFQLTNPTFAVHAALYSEFSDEVMLDVFDALIPVGQVSLDVAEGALVVAQTALDGAQTTLDNAVWVAGEAARVTMNTAYSAYQTSVSRYNGANSNYSYYSNRCHWTRPIDCSRAGYWASARAFWNGQRTVTYGVYQAARVVYLNRDFIDDTPPVRAAQNVLNGARATFNAALVEVNRMSASLDQMDAWLDAVQACATCPRPPVPLSLVSAEFDAALDGFFGQSGVQLLVVYQVFGDRRALSAGFSGSISDLASSLVTTLTDAIF
jgi:hypothetical protein